MEDIRTEFGGKDGCDEEGCKWLGEGNEDGAKRAKGRKGGRGEVE